VIPCPDGEKHQSGSTKPCGDAGGVHSIIQTEIASLRRPHGRKSLPCGQLRAAIRLNLSVRPHHLSPQEKGNRNQKCRRCGRLGSAYALPYLYTPRNDERHGTGVHGSNHLTFHSDSTLSSTVDPPYLTREDQLAATYRAQAPVAGFTGNQLPTRLGRATHHLESVD